MKTALLTGITGQDGSYLAEILLAKGYDVHGIVRRASMYNRSRIEHLRSSETFQGRFHLHYADLTDATVLRRIFIKVQPDEFYHLAGQSHPGLSFEIPESTCAETANATLSILEILRDLERPPRVLHASSSEVFGSPDDAPQNEDTPFRPVTPYGCAKAFATDLCRVYREAHDLFVCNTISFNHESPRRGENFVTQKIVMACKRIAAGSVEVLELGSLDAQRDWGYAPEYVNAMWGLLQLDRPTDVVLATGTSTSVRQFVQAAFGAVGMSLHFEGIGVNEVALNGPKGRVLVLVSPRYSRPLDPKRLVGNPRKAGELLRWKAVTAGTAVAQRMVLETETSESSRSPAPRAG